MSDQQACNYCGGPTTIATAIQPLGSEPGHYVWFCEACKRHTWAKRRMAQQEQPHDA